MATIRFCRSCNNMLYPKENIAQRKLEFVCKLCPYKEINVSSSCVRLTELVKDQSSVFSSSASTHRSFIEQDGFRRDSK
jgi:DNA-directed RNA polymerase subunit M/transcription elongation factor TFIIS